MKHINIYFYLIVFCLLFSTGCNIDREDSSSDLVKGVISVSACSSLENQESENMISDNMTKSGNDIVYTIEAWTRGADSFCAMHKVMAGEIDGVADIEIFLVPGQYDFLFWADYGENYYNSSNLKAVSLSQMPYETGNNRDAFAGVIENVVWDGNASLNVILTRPLSKLSICNTNVFNDSAPVSVEYHGLYTRYNVLTGEVSALNENLEVLPPDIIIGSDIVMEDYVFVPEYGQDISMKVSVGSVAKEIENIPLKPNYKTNVRATF